MSIPEKREPQIWAAQPPNLGEVNNGGPHGAFESKESVQLFVKGTDFVGLLVVCSGLSVKARRRQSLRFFGE